MMLNSRDFTFRYRTTKYRITTHNALAPSYDLAEGNLVRLALGYWVAVAHLFMDWAPLHLPACGNTTIVGRLSRRVDD